MTQTNYDKLEPIVKENGEVVYEAPIVIHDKADLQNYHITWEDCKTLHFGTSGSVVVYYYQTPDKGLAELFWREINTEHSCEYRSNRCMIPGKLKPLIICPDTNKCSKCPYPKYRDQHLANNISWDELTKDGKEIPSDDNDMARVEIQMELEKVCEVISKKNPKFTKAIILKEYYHLSVRDIAKELNDSERNVYYYLQEAKRIGKKYKEENYD